MRAVAYNGVDMPTNQMGPGVQCEVYFCLLVEFILNPETFTALTSITEKPHVDVHSARYVVGENLVPVRATDFLRKHHQIIITFSRFFRLFSLQKHHYV